MDLDQFWLAAGWLAEARHWWGIALSSGAGSTEERVLAGALSARFAAMQHDLPVARSTLDQARAEAQRITAMNGPELPTSNEVRASLLLPEAMLTVWSGDRMGAVQAAEEAVEMLESSDEQMSLRLTAWEMLGTFRGFAGDREGRSPHTSNASLWPRESARRSAVQRRLRGWPSSYWPPATWPQQALGFANALAMKADLGDRFGVALGLGLARSSRAGAW